MSGDGRPDLLLAAPSGGPSMSGAAYVVFGRASTTPFRVSSAFAAGGYAIEGDMRDVVAALGDVSGDGKPDAALGDSQSSLGGRTTAGAVHVVYGKATTGTLDLTSLTNAQGYRIDGPTANGLAGFSVAGAGDVFGGSLADVIVGAIRVGANGRLFSGSAFVVAARPSLPALIGRASILRDPFAIAQAATPGILTLRGQPARGTTITYDLRGPARVRLRIERIVPGRRTRTGCVRDERTLPRSQRCVRHVASATFVRVHRAKGLKRFAFSGRAGSKALPPGRYRADVTARNAAGRQSGPVRATFEILRG